MAKILLINPSYRSTYTSFKAAVVNPVHPTLGLATIAAMATQSRHKVKIEDLSYTSYNHMKIKDLIKSFNPDVIGITATTPLFNQLRDISQIAKNISKDILVIGGGCHVSALPEESLLESYLDYVVQGEGEHAFHEIIEGHCPQSIPGLYYRTSEGTVSFTGVRSLVKHLDSLPFPAWHLYDANIYKHKISRLLAKRPPMTMIEFSRGCVFHCDFCASKNTVGKGLRKKSPERIVEEMKHVKNLGFKEVALADDIFTSDKNWAMSVCEEIIKSNLNLVWSCTNGIRVESADQELFSLMKKAGCYRVSFGFESGSNVVLEKFGKGGKASIEQGKKAVKLARKAGLDTSGFFLLGLSPDTEETMEATIQYARSLELDMLKFGITIAFPGTPMFNNYKHKGLIKSFDWDDYNIFTNKSLFSHESLSFKTIQKFMKRGYLEAIIKNPKFIYRRIKRGIKTGEFFWDVYYFVKFCFLPPSNSPKESCEYAHNKEWPKVDHIKD